MHCETLFSQASSLEDSGLDRAVEEFFLLEFKGARLSLGAEELGDPSIGASPGILRELANVMLFF